MLLSRLSLVVNSLMLLSFGHGYLALTLPPADTHADAILTPTKQPMVHAARLTLPSKDYDKSDPLRREDKTLIKATYPGRISQTSNVNNPLAKGTPPYTDTDYWLGNPALKHGSMPFAYPGYAFFRNVKDPKYGAKGDGVTDDTEAINKALRDGNRCLWDCGSTTVKGAVVYFPPGTYLISSTIVQPYYTEFKGDAINKPIIKAKNFKYGDNIMFDTNPYRAQGDRGVPMFIPQNQFFRSMENFVLDASEGGPHTVLHWHVSQSTHLRNIEIKMKKGGDQTGIHTEDGSGGFVSDVTVYGGEFGWDYGNQQYTIRNMKFVGCTIAIRGNWNWGLTLKNIQVIDAEVGISAIPNDPESDFSLILLDSEFTNVNTILKIKDKTASGKKPSVVLDSIYYKNVEAVVRDSQEIILFDGRTSKAPITRWTLGNSFIQSSFGVLSGPINNELLPNKPEALRDPATGKIFERTKPLYEELKTDDIINVLLEGAANNATGDQTAVLNRILRKNVGKVIYFPAGVYLVKGTVKVPSGSKIVGEGWPAIMATGPYFADVKKPKVMVEVGKPGDVGTMEISNMLFTVKGRTAGAILVKWNIKASTLGAAAMWDSHFRIGGAKGTDLQTEQCGKDLGEWTKDACMAASVMLHIAKSSNGYFENMWVWTADHDLDKPVGGDSNSERNLINISVGRGVLIESEGPTWLSGTASEHTIIAQYSVEGAKNLYMGSIQTETVYYQPNYGKSADRYLEAAGFDVTNEKKPLGLALRIYSSKNVYIAGAGLYSFYTDNKQPTGKLYHQDRIVDIQNSNQITIANLYTRGSEEVLPGVAAKQVQEKGSTLLSVAYFQEHLLGDFDTQCKSIRCRGGH